MWRLSASERAAIEIRRVERVYSALAGVYDAAFDWAFWRGRCRAVDRLEVAGGDRVLEVGVGTGLSLPYYPQDAEITGIDISEPMLDRAAERAEQLDRQKPNLRLMDARHLAFPTAAFDHVLAPYVISVVPEPRRVMQEIRRVTRPGGTVIVVNHFGSPKRSVRAIERAMSPVSQWIGFRLDLPIETVTETPGLVVERIERVNPFGLWRLIELRRVD